MYPAFVFPGSILLSRMTGDFLSKLDPYCSGEDFSGGEIQGGYCVLPPVGNVSTFVRKEQYSEDKRC